MELNFVEILGYLASVLVAISLLMSSIIKLRWINLVGSLTFSIYGIIIGAAPVAAVNGFIFFVNIYFLFKIYSATEYFKLLPVPSNDVFFNEFMQFHSAEIAQLFPAFNPKRLAEAQCNLVLRNTSVAGVFIAIKQNETLEVLVDFVAPEYRDFKTGEFIYRQKAEYFKSLGFNCIQANAFGKYHESYLRKMKFAAKENSSTTFIKML